MKIDYISDLHLDFYVSHDSNYIKWENKTHKFLQGLLPETVGEILIVAGDISHYNIQSKWCLEYFSVWYEQIFIVLGNHDYYLVSDGQSKKYKHQSKNREEELLDIIYSLEKVTVLKNFDVIFYKTISLSGSTSWYPLTEFNDISFFDSVSNDSRLIKGIDIGYENYKESLSYDKLKEVDILVTHVPPILINSHHKYGSSSCYLNEIKDIKAKHCVFGHCHEQCIYDKSGVKFYINALGYHNEWISHMDIMKYSKEERVSFASKWNVIKSFEI